ncbi:DUF4411 family protein [Pleomorphomonas sp. NRK KF1]|uniref:DUF4411 family protein n=1 Tax=Pleomorphomonas sp. NRK KF1 TaxID=2943000 RepID=UPI002042D8A2|nr:DUF4411 family protein [Pleomorphomonas sp. NRK KF1]MCM5555321.1 DUF4411 family protein [Pleomorphomonas sp. NRK KF1]
MMDRHATYCIDTSSLLHAWFRAYPPKRFGSLWGALDRLIDEGRLLATIEVLYELKKKDDGLFEWAKFRRELLFREIDDGVQSEVVRIMEAYPKLVDTGKGKSGGDPFVIAQALAARPRLVVVTQELGGSLDKPKIPFVCDQEGIRHIDFLELIEEEDWVF